jgi:uncharacterized membrane protein YqjE
MRDFANNGHSSLLDPIWRLLDTGLATAQNRLELFRVEAREEKIRIFQIILLVSALIILGTLALALATFAIAIVVWQSGALIVLPCVIAAYAIGAGMAWRALRARLNGEGPFAASAEELRKDRECIPR